MAHARKYVIEQEVDEQPTDIAALIAYLEALRATIPAEERAKFPKAASLDIDHYLYGAPKQSS